MTPYDMVKEFRTKFEKENKFSNLNCERQFTLIDEEVEEIYQEIYDDFFLRENKEIDKASLTKEICDLIYVCYDMAIALELPIEEAFKRVHQSNMSKLGEDGKPIKRDDGKILKGPNYTKPKLTDLF
jgi:predicted HAD superfamily Cof-like phosphohydrolase